MRLDFFSLARKIEGRLLGDKIHCRAATHIFLPQTGQNSTQFDHGVGDEHERLADSDIGNDFSLGAGPDA